MIDENGDIVMENVESSNIAQKGYNPETKVFRVLFHNGGVFEYDGVPEDIALGIDTASSVGGYFHSMIRSVFPARRIR